MRDAGPKEKTKRIKKFGLAENVIAKMLLDY